MVSPVLILVAGIYIYKVKTPPPIVKQWNTRLEQTQPEPVAELSDSRRQLFSELDTFIYNTTANKGGDKQIRILTPFLKSGKLLDLRLKNLEQEIATTQVPQDKVKIWYIYNMGIVAKSANATVGFDLSGEVLNTRYNSDIKRIAQLCDILVVSHEHNDHFDPPLLKEAAQQGTAVVLPHGATVGPRAAEKIRKLVPECKEQIIDVPLEETVTVKNVDITAYKAGHRRTDTPDNNWLVVDLAGVRLVHTGDGMLKNGNWNKIRPVDVFLMNESLETFEMKDSRARMIIPLHIHCLGHANHINTMKREQYTTFLEKLEGGEELHPNTKVIPLLWGESIEVAN